MSQQSDAGQLQTVAVPPAPGGAQSPQPPVIPQVWANVKSPEQVQVTWPTLPPVAAHRVASLPPDELVDAEELDPEDALVVPPVPPLEVEPPIQPCAVSQQPPFGQAQTVAL